MQRRSCAESRRSTQPSVSKRSSRPARVAPSIPIRAAISFWVSLFPPCERCMSVRHFPWLRPSGRKRWSSFVRQARAVPKRTRPSSLMFTGGMTKLVSVLTNPDWPDCQKLLVPYPHQNHRVVSIIGEVSHLLRPQREPILVSSRLRSAERRGTAPVIPRIS